MGKLYMNSKSIKNLIEKITFSSYESMIRYLKGLRETFPKVDVFIYEDELNHFEIHKSDLE